MAVLSHDLGGRFLFANDTFVRVLHTKPMALLGRWVGWTAPPRALSSTSHLNYSA